MVSGSPDQNSQVFHPQSVFLQVTIHWNKYISWGNYQKENLGSLFQINYDGQIVKFIIISITK